MVMFMTVVDRNLTIHVSEIGLRGANDRTVHIELQHQNTCACNARESKRRRDRHYESFCQLPKICGWSEVVNFPK